MDSFFLNFQDFINENQIILENKFLDKVFKKFSFNHFSKNSIITTHFSTNSKIEDITKIQLKKEHQIIYISDYLKKCPNNNFHSDYFIICFANMLIFIEQSQINELYQFFFQNKELSIYVLSENITRIITLFEKSMNFHLKIEDANESQFFKEEIESFSQKFCFKKNKKAAIMFKQYHNLFTIIFEAISGFLIKTSYYKFLNYDRNENIDNYYKKSTNNVINEDEFVELRILDEECTNHISLIYHIEYEKLFILKTFIDEKAKVLFERERDNYKIINFPLFPRYFGKTQRNLYEGIIIEYIQGNLLKNIHEMNFSDNIKFKIIFQIIIAIHCLHCRGYIYRDLKPDNIIINKQGSITLIDFDRMISDTQNYQFTLDFQHDFIAPEIISGSSFSTKSDIYSIGKIIEFIFSNDFINKYPELKDICEKCTMIEDSKRPDISQLIDCYYSLIFSKISIVDESDIIKSIINIHSIEFDYFLLFISEYNCSISCFYLKLHHLQIFKDNNYAKIIKYLTFAANNNVVGAQYELGSIYFLGEHVKQNINKAIYYFTLASNQNLSDAQFFLGTLFGEGKYVKQDIKKSIYYYSLSSDQGHSNSQYNLGVLYYNGIYIQQDVNKAIHYFTLASNQNNARAQYILGLIYYNGDYIRQDINKAIYYFTLASNQCFTNAHFVLGLIYYNGNYVQQDINRAIYYFTLASNQNNSDAQFILGALYNQNKYFARNINKSIHYLTLASNQNNAYAQYKLGILFLEGKYVVRDIQKSIYYYSLASNQNYSNAQYHLGIIYYEGKYIQRDINKALHYFTLASNQNNSNAQFILGIIYYEGKYIQKNINKAIHYFSLSSNGNNSNAQIVLGEIYLEGEYVQQDINKSIRYISLSASSNNPYALLIYGCLFYDGEFVKQDINKCIEYLSKVADNIIIANYFLGCIYCKGYGVDRDIDKAINYFKKGSSFNEQYSKNNLGILFKNFKNNVIAIEYFEEAIRQKNDKISMYNLGHIYFYGKFVKKNIDKSIELFVKSAKQGFYPSKILSGLVLVKKISPINIQNIANETAKYGNHNTEFDQDILMIILDTKIYIDIHYVHYYSYYEHLEFLYDINYEEIPFSYYMKKEQKNEKAEPKSLRKNVSNDFYDGFAINI